MTKLLKKYRTSPTLKNAQALRAYSRKHPFSNCLLQAADMDLLVEAIHHANREG